MKERLDRSSPVPLFHQIVQAVRWAVSSGELAPGDELPSSREGGAEWGVNRHTVRRAYQELQSMGLVRAQKAGRLVVTDPVAGGDASEPPSPQEMAALVDRFVADARDRFGLTAGEAAALVAERQHAGARPGTMGHLTVVECNLAQCADLAHQVEARWKVDAELRVLGDGDEPPEGQVVATLYHFEEVRERWPEVAADAHFVGLLADPAVGRLVEHLTKTYDGKAPALVADRAGRNMAADLLPLLPQGAQLEVLDWDPERSDELLNSLEGRVTLVSQRVWSQLDAEQRRSPHLVEVRYLIPRRDLEVLGAVFDWEGRS